VAARRYSFDANDTEVTRAQPAVDRQVELRKVALLSLDLELRPD